VTAWVTSAGSSAGGPGSGASVQAPVLLLRAAEGFNPGQPPLLPDDVVAAEGMHVANFTERMLPGTTHYTIALGREGARAVADAIVDIAEAAGR